MIHGLRPNLSPARLRARVLELIQSGSKTGRPDSSQDQHKKRRKRRRQVTLNLTVQRKYRFPSFTVGLVYFKDTLQSSDPKCMSNRMLFGEYQAKTPNLYS